MGGTQIKAAAGGAGLDQQRKLTQMTVFSTKHSEINVLLVIKNCLRRKNVCTVAFLFFAAG
jgi:hypothetical protein